MNLTSRSFLRARRSRPFQKVLAFLYLFWYIECLDDRKAQTHPARILEIERRARTCARVVELPREDQRKIGRDIAKVQFGWPIGLPVCRPLSQGLWEVRSSLPSKREARVLFGFYNGMLIALHGFIKKRQQTPPEDLALARQRLKEVLS